MKERSFKVRSAKYKYWQHIKNAFAKSLPLYGDNQSQKSTGHMLAETTNGLKLRLLHITPKKFKFTHECETNSSIAFLDMMICRSEGEVTSTRHTKPTGTGLTINYHALVPQEYKRSAICGLVHRIYPACNTWKNFHESLIKAKMILENNQCPLLFLQADKLREPWIKL